MALRSVGRWEDALRTMNDALDRYEALEQVEAIGRLGWAMVYQLVWTARFVEGVQVGQRALAALGNTVNADKARLLSAMAWAISLSGDYVAATATFDQARALAEQVGNERALADVLHVPACGRDFLVGERVVGSLQRAGVRDLRGRHARQS